MSSRADEPAHVDGASPDSGRVSLVGRLLVEWYVIYCERFPWRMRTDDPYAVWVAEVMLQQTQARTVIPYYEAWLTRFPDVYALADAPLSEVLRAWQGLGYYGRARRMHAAARAIVEWRGGRFPDTVRELRRLPGVGRYTAAAIACIAYGHREPPIDTNASRVLSRIEGWQYSGEAYPTPAKFASTWLQMAPEEYHAEFAQALMDLGRQICTPTNPLCTKCPAAVLCTAWQRGWVERCTPRRPRAERIRQNHVSIVAWWNGAVLVSYRDKGDLWAGLWEFPRREVPSDGSVTEVAEDLAAGLMGSTRQVLHPLPIIRHAVTRYYIALHAFVCHRSGGETGRPPEPEGCVWMPWAEVLQLPMPSPQVRLRRLVEEAGLPLAKP